MPTYQAPSSDHLQTVIQRLHTSYKGSNRRALVERIQTIAANYTQPDQQPIVLGLLVNALADIADEYHVLSPEEKAIGVLKNSGNSHFIFRQASSYLAQNLFSTGSSLDSLLRHALLFSDHNVLDKFHRLIYLQALHTAATSAADTALQQSSEKHLQTAVKECEPEIKALSKKRFSAPIVQQQFSALPARYSACKQASGATSSRDALLALIEAVDKQLQQSDEAVSNYSYNNTVRHAVIVFIMDELETEYAHSDLYDLCQQAINVKHTNHISILEKYNYFSALHALIPKLMSPTNGTHVDSDLQQFLSAITGKLLRKMSAAYEALENGHIYQSLDCVRTLINMTMTFGIGILIGNFTSSYAVLSAEQRIFSRFVGSVAHSRYGFAAKIVAQQTAVIVEQAAVNTAISSTLRRAANYVANVPGDAVYYTLSVPATIAASMKHLLDNPDEKPFHENREFIHALTLLPDAVLAKKTKEVLSKIELYLPDVKPTPVDAHPITMRPRSRSF